MGILQTSVYGYGKILKVNRTGSKVRLGRSLSILVLLIAIAIGGRAFVSNFGSTIRPEAYDDGQCIVYADDSPAPLKYSYLKTFVKKYRKHYYVAARASSKFFVRACNSELHLNAGMWCAMDPHVYAGSPRDGPEERPAYYEHLYLLALF